MTNISNRQKTLWNQKSENQIHWLEIKIELFMSVGRQIYFFIFNFMETVKITWKQKIINLMSDWKFHSNQELCRTAGWSFNQYIFKLKADWYEFEKKDHEKWESKYIVHHKMTKVPNWIQMKLNINAKTNFDPKEKFLWNTNIQNPNFEAPKSWFQKLFWL
jgi:hypothetical protein